MGMTGFQPKTRIENEACINTNTANLNTGSSALKPVIPITSPVSVAEELMPPSEIKAPVTDRPDLEAAATRSNLTTLKPGDRVYVAHQLLPHGRLHPATITKVVNASVHFDPPIKSLLNDPDDPDAGEWTPPHPLQMASLNACVPEQGATTGRTRRHTVPLPARFEPLDQNGIEEFLSEIEEGDAFIARGLRNLQRTMEAA
jgi:hypothetical protein